MDPDCAATGDGQEQLPEQLPEHATVASEPPSYLPASQLLQVEAPASEYVPDTQLLQVEAPASEYLPAGHREHVPVSQFPTKPAPVPDESLVNLTRMYPVVDVQLRLDEMLLPLSDASSELDLHDVALSDDEQL